MSHSFIDRSSNYFTQNYDNEEPQKKIDPIAQLKEINNTTVREWGPFNNPPAQMFARDEEEEEMQAKIGDEEQQQKAAPGSTGTATHLPSHVQAKMESSFGTDFSGVNIHANSGQATNIGALAYTQGNDVHFAPGQFNPGSQKGQELIGHELTHVVQQRQGRVKPDKQGKGMNINSNPALEKEADVMGAKAAKGEITNVIGNANYSIQGVIPVGTTLDTKTNEIEIESNDDGKINVKFYTVGGEEKTQEVSKNVTTIRQWILDNYNWNGIIRIMKYVSDESTKFHYTIPDDLSGTTDDDLKIIPDEGIFAIIEIQVDNNINGVDITNDNYESFMNGVDGMPGDKFAEIMGEEDKNAIRNEGDNTNIIDEEGNEIEIPVFNSANEETLYEFFKDITLARNGLWSKNENITNIVSLRRAIDENETQYNDTIAVCWISKDGDTEKKNAKIYTATTEPGEIDDHRQLVPQTLTMELGYHKGRQPGGRTSQALIQDKGNSDKVNYYDGDTTMNFHHGGNGDVNLLGMSTSGLSTDYVSTEEEEFEINTLYVEAFRILTQWGKKRDVKAYEYLKDWKEAVKYEFTEIKDGKVKFKKNGTDDIIERDINGIKDYIANKYSVNNENKDILVRIIQSVDNTFIIPENIYDLGKDELKELITENHVKGILEKQMNYIKDVGDIDGKPGKSYISILDGEMETFDFMHGKALTDFNDLEDVFTDLKDILGDDVAKDKIDYLKDLEPGTITEREMYEGDNSITGENTDGSQTIEQDVDAWSEGCQVVFGPEKFYEFWGHVTDKAMDSGQRRWYYTIINLETQETTTEETTE
ncbi:MAG TPA: DUF4157 domain-containing protein [Bacteroidales bacterium]|nr:DUF4157 domain-containing protein [Bacteroidales bacterium]